MCVAPLPPLYKEERRFPLLYIEPLRREGVCLLNIEEADTILNCKESALSRYIYIYIEKRDNVFFFIKEGPAPLTLKQNAH